MSTTEEPLDPWGMAWVHQVYRREFGLLPDLIKGVAEGDRERAAVVGEHLALMADSLHGHHVAEDEIIWPLLKERAGAEIDQVLQMEHQHDELHSLLLEIEKVAPRWRDEAGLADRDRLAELVAEVSRLTNAHFEQEEAEVMPLVHRHIVQSEWIQFELAGHAAIPQDKALLFLGMGLEDATEHERAKFTGGLPPEVLQFWEGPGKEQYAQQRAQLLGTA